MDWDKLVRNVLPWRIVVMHQDTARSELPASLQYLLWTFDLVIEGQGCGLHGSSAEELREDLKPHVTRVRNPWLRAPPVGICEHSSHTAAIRRAMAAAGRTITHTHFWAGFRNEFQDAVDIPPMTQWAVRHVAASTGAGVSKWHRGMEGTWVWREMDAPLVLVFQTDEGLSTAVAMHGPAAPLEKRLFSAAESEARRREMLGRWEALVHDVAAATGVTPRVPDFVRRGLGEH